MTTPERSSDLERLRSDAEYMHFLVAAGELLSSSLNYRATLKNICASAVRTVADICVLEIGSVRDSEIVGIAHKQRERLASFTREYEALRGESARIADVVSRVLDSGQPLSVFKVDDAWIERNAATPRHAEFMRRYDYRSMIVVPVRSLVWGIAGTLTLVRTGLTNRPYDEDAVLFAEELGRRCGLAIGKARLHSQTVDIAERLQKAALPKSLPKVDGFTFDYFYEPADAALLVGGDWYDVFLLKDGKLGFSIGDVSGHGIESAALMSSIRNAIRMGLVIKPDLLEVLDDADFLFRNEAPEAMFCTALIGVIDPQTGRMSCASAGHPGPLIWRRGSLEAPMKTPTVPLGVGHLNDAPAAAASTTLEPGSTMVLYTDGLVECRRNHVAGEMTLREALQDPGTRNAASPARAIRDRVISGAHADDVAVLTIQYKGH